MWIDISSYVYKYTNEQLYTYICTCMYIYKYMVALVVKKLPANSGDIRDVGSIPGLGRFPGGGHGNLL